MDDFLNYIYKVGLGAVDGKLLEVGSFALEVVGGDRVYFQTTVAPNEGSNFLRQIFIDLFRIYLLFCLLNCWTYLTLGAF